jgi:hypothetical protein
LILSIQALTVCCRIIELCHPEKRSRHRHFEERSDEKSFFTTAAVNDREKNRVAKRMKDIGTIVNRPRAEGLLKEYRP